MHRTDGRSLSAKQEERKVTAALLTLNDKVAEIEELSDTAGYEVLYEVLQRRSRPEPALFMGRGKLDDVKELLDLRKVEVLIVNGELEPSQHYQLESELGVECVDRVKVVLNIFRKRAHSKEAMLQVERARLQYEIPFLKEWIHNAKAGEHPGFLGGGEYAVDVYFNLIRKRMRKIDAELKGLKEDQSLRREHRKKRGFFLVSLAGYTNAGKSSLMRRLTGEEVIIENKMFSTLTTTTRKIQNIRKDVLLTDTIGFLQDLPHFLIESFRNTIEDIYTSDLILLVLDSSNETSDFIRKLDTSKSILLPDVDPKNILVVLNKTDLLASGMKERIEIVRSRFPLSDIALTSVATGYGLDVLRTKILERFTYPVRLKVKVPQSDGLQSLISYLYDETDILSVAYAPETVIELYCRNDDQDRIRKKIAALGGTETE